MMKKKYYLGNANFAEKSLIQKKDVDFMKMSIVQKEGVRIHIEIQLNKVVCYKMNYLILQMMMIGYLTSASALVI